MGVCITGYAEVSPAGRWEFAEELLFSGNKELAMILTSGGSIRSSEAYTPIVPCRGLPSDLSRYLASRLQQRLGVCYSWFTAREATEFDWENQIMRRRAYVPRQAASLFTGCPRGFPLKNWPSDVEISIATWSIDGVEVEWLESYAEIVPQFVYEVLPQLYQLGPLDQVRLIIEAEW